MSSILRSSITTIRQAIPFIFIENEVPAGVIDGVNTVFTLTYTPMPSTVLLFSNGLHQNNPGDYTIVGNTITFTSAPPSGSYLLASYKK